MKPLQHVAEDLRMLRMLCARALELDESDATEDGQGINGIDALNFQENARKAFREMLDRLENGRALELSDKQRAWVRGVFERVFDSPTYENLFSSGKLCLGKPVETPAVLRRENLPLKPPGRR